MLHLLLLRVLDGVLWMRGGRGWPGHPKWAPAPPRPNPPQLDTLNTPPHHTHVAMPKKLNTNPKAQAAREREAAVKSAARSAAETAAENARWSDEGSTAAERRRAEKAAKDAEEAKKRAEKKALLAKEEVRRACQR